jgi:hypothetical protein
VSGPRRITVLYCIGHERPSDFISSVIVGDAMRCRCCMSGEFPLCSSAAVGPKSHASRLKVPKYPSDVTPAPWCNGSREQRTLPHIFFPLRPFSSAPSHQFPSLVSPLPVIRPTVRISFTMSSVARLGSTAVRASLRAPAFNTRAVAFNATRAYSSSKSQVRNPPRHHLMQCICPRRRHGLTYALRP